MSEGDSATRCDEHGKPVFRNPPHVYCRFRSINACNKMEEKSTLLGPILSCHLEEQSAAKVILGTQLKGSCKVKSLHLKSAKQS